MDDLIGFWTDIFSEHLIYDINNCLQKLFETCQSNECVNDYNNFNVVLKSASEMLHTSIKDKINEYHQNLKRELEKAYNKDKPSSSESSQDNNVTDQVLKLKEELKKKGEELEKAYCIMEIMRLSSMELSLNG